MERIPEIEVTPKFANEVAREVKDVVDVEGVGVALPEGVDQ